MLWVCGDGRKAALDLGLVGYTTGRPPKVEAVAREILDRWLPSLEHPEGPNFQIIFCDLGTPKEKGGAGIYGKIRSTRGMAAQQEPRPGTGSLFLRERPAITRGG